MTTYLVKYADEDGAAHYHETIAATASEAIYHTNLDCNVHLILSVYVKV